MSAPATLAAYLALLHESYVAFVTLFKMVFNEDDDFVDLFEILFSVVCCCFLAYGVIRRFRPILKIWMLLVYAHIDWSGVVNLLISVFEYLFTDKYQNKEEFTKDLGETHASIVEPPREKLQAKLAKMCTKIYTQ